MLFIQKDIKGTFTLVLFMVKNATTIFVHKLSDLFIISGSLERICRGMTHEKKTDVGILQEQNIYFSRKIFIATKKRHAEYKTRCISPLKHVSSCFNKFFRVKVTTCEDLGLILTHHNIFCSFKNL